MSTSQWLDRRGLTQKGKEVHSPSNPEGRKFHETGVGEAIRRASTSSTSGSPLEKFPTSGSGRRRSSAGSQSGLFGSLNNMKRGSEDYSERRASQTDMMGQGGRVSGWFNSTFRGIQQSSNNQAGDQTKNDASKRGVME